MTEEKEKEEEIEVVKQKIDVKYQVDYATKNAYEAMNNSLALQKKQQAIVTLMHALNITKIKIMSEEDCEPGQIYH